MRKTIIIMTALLCIMAVSCGNSVEEGRTSLSLTLQDAGTSRTIMPSETLMEVQKYSVSGVGPSGATFGPLVSTDSELSIRDIAVGSWTITAKALNAQNNELANGSGTTVVNKGSNQATIVLDRMTGSGSLELDFTWDPEICDESRIRINLSLEDSKGNVVSKSRDVSTSAGKASVVVNLDAGCHVLTIQVQDSGGNIGVGATEAVRIVSNTRSKGTVELKGTKPASSSNGTSITLENRIGTPMSFYMDYYPKNLSAGKFMTLNACYLTLPAGVEESDLTYQWYKDGVLMSPASADNISMLAMGGSHRFDVIVRSGKEGTMCGASLNLNIPD